MAKRDMLTVPWKAEDRAENLPERFRAICAANSQNMSEVIRKFIREWTAEQEAQSKRKVRRGKAE